MGDFGQRLTRNMASEVSALDFAIAQKLRLVRTSIPVVVKAIHGGGVDAPPTVDVQPLVNMIDGQGQQVAHATVYGVPVIRLQSGKSTIIIDPQVNDVGLLLVADSDISAVKANKGKQSNPGSFRKHNLADGLYLGGILNSATPNQYVELNKDGIKLLDANRNSVVMTKDGMTLTDANGNVIAMKSGEIDITAATVKITGNLTVTGGVTAGAGGADSVTLQHHQHPANNTPPTPGT